MKHELSIYESELKDKNFVQENQMRFMVWWVKALHVAGSAWGCPVRGSSGKEGPEGLADQAGSGSRRTVRRHVSGKPGECYSTRSSLLVYFTCIQLL